MSVPVLLHGVPKKRDPRIPISTMILGALSVFVAVGFLIFAGSLLLAVIMLLVFGVPAIPWTDQGNILLWVIYKWQHRNDWKGKRNIVQQPSIKELRRTSKKSKSPFDNYELLAAHLPSQGDPDSVDVVPYILTLDRMHVTFFIMTNGASIDWLQSEVFDRFGFDLGLYEQLNNAFVTYPRAADVRFGTGFHQRPADKTHAWEYVKERGQERTFTAPMPQDGDSEAERLYRARTINVARIDQGYDYGMEPVHLFWVDLPIDRNILGRPIDMANPKVFEKSANWILVSELFLALNNFGFMPRLPTRLEATSFLSRYLESDQSPYIDFLVNQARTSVEEGAIESESESLAADMEGWKPYEIEGPDYSPKEQRGFRLIGGTYHVAGMVKSFNREHVESGYYHQMSIPQGVCYSVVTINRVVKLSADKRAKEGREAIHRMGSVKQHLLPWIEDTDHQVKGDIYRQERFRLSMSNGLAGEFNIFVIGTGSTLEEAESAYEEVRRKLKEANTVRIHNPDKIGDIVSAAVGMLGKRSH